jgi:hypothetical protein
MKHAADHGAEALAPRRLDVLRVGEMGGIYRVGTFREENPGRCARVRAYTRWWNPEWPDCVVYEVTAGSARAARVAAAKHRKENP